MAVLYLILVVISFLFYILFEGVISLMIFLFILVMPLLFQIICFTAAMLTDVTVDLPVKTSPPKQDIPVKITINNRSPFPINCAEIILEIKVSSDERTEKLRINTPVFPLNSQTLTAGFSSEHYGAVSCRLKAVKVFDMLRLFRMKLPQSHLKRQGDSVTILPEAVSLSNQVASYADLGLDSDEYSPDKAGDDPSEIFDVREYHEGDKLSKVHWKLTAKQGELMVKDYSLPLSDSCLLLTDLYSDHPSGGSSVYDIKIKTAFSISTLLQTNSVRHKTAVYDSKSSELLYSSVNDEQSLIAAAAQSVMLEHPKEPGLALMALVSEENSSLRFGHLILITSYFDDSQAKLLEGSGIAMRYTVLLCIGNEPPQFDIPQTETEIIPVYQDIDQSLMQLII